MLESVTTCWGLQVGPYILEDGGVMWAEVVPGRKGGWWYEIHSKRPSEQDTVTWAYTDRGSGGAFTFRRCVRQARDALYYLAYQREDVDA